MRPCIYRSQCVWHAEINRRARCQHKSAGQRRTSMTNIQLFEVQEIGLTYRPILINRKKITCSNDAAEVFRTVYDRETFEYKEYFYVMLLKQNNEVLGIKKISEGGMTATVVDVREIFAIALKGAACGIIICHNHPSGNKNPSSNDIRLTEKIKKAGELLDLRLLDHVILTASTYTSFADEGIV